MFPLGKVYRGSFCTMSYKCMRIYNYLNKIFNEKNGQKI